MRACVDTLLCLTAAAPLPNWRQAYSLKAHGWIPMRCASGLIDQNGFGLLFATATPHRMGAALTYARRFFSLVGIAGEVARS